MITTVDTLQKVQLVDGEFTPSEASDLIKALIKEKINFHKIHRLSIWEGNMDGDTSFDDSRVTQLQREQLNFQSLCLDARTTGKKIKINGILEIELID